MAVRNECQRPKLKATALTSTKGGFLFFWVQRCFRHLFHDFPPRSQDAPAQPLGPSAQTEGGAANFSTRAAATVTLGSPWGLRRCGEEGRRELRGQKARGNGKGAVEGSDRDSRNWGVADCNSERWEKGRQLDWIQDGSQVENGFF